MPGNFGAEALCLRILPTGSGEEFYFFNIAAISTERFVETRMGLYLSCHTFGFYTEKPG